MNLITLTTATVLVALPTVTLAQSMPIWQINSDASTLTFDFTQQGGRNTGTFGTFNGEINFDPNNLDASAVRVVVDTFGAVTGNADRDGQLAGGAWLNVQAFPEAVFESTGFTYEGGNAYVALGQLSIKGIVRDVEMPFTLEINGNDAFAKGSLLLNRTDFEVGVGNWAGPSPVGHSVVVNFSIEASRAN
jgi:polyisoprenoid-binding protein YceI